MPCSEHISNNESKPKFIAVCANPLSAFIFKEEFDIFSNEGFAETIYGRKRWFLTAPDVDIQEYFHPNKTTLQWYVLKS